MSVPVPAPSESQRSLPRRDGDARARLAAVGVRGAPSVLARSRALSVPGPLAAAVPEVQRGSVVVVGGRAGSGATSVALGLAAAASAAGEWAALVEDVASVGGLAAAEAGIDLERFAVVRPVSREQWPTVVAALLDGMSVVLATVPRGVRVGDARRLIARARERCAVLVPMGTDPRVWPVEAALRIEARGGAWGGLGVGDGVLAARSPAVMVSGRGRRAVATSGPGSPPPAALGRTG
jgi:hypothetical protein